MADGTTEPARRSSRIAAQPKAKEEAPKPKAVRKPSAKKREVTAADPEGPAAKKVCFFARCIALCRGIRAEVMCLSFFAIFATRVLILSSVVVQAKGSEEAANDSVGDAKVEEPAEKAGMKIDTEFFKLKWT